MTSLLFSDATSWVSSQINIGRPCGPLNLQTNLSQLKNTPHQHCKHSKTCFLLSRKMNRNTWHNYASRWNRYAVTSEACSWRWRFRPKLSCIRSYNETIVLPYVKGFVITTTAVTYTVLTSCSQSKIWTHDLLWENKCLLDIYILTMNECIGQI